MTWEGTEQMTASEATRWREVEREEIETLTQEFMRVLKLKQGADGEVK